MSTGKSNLPSLKILGETVLLKPVLLLPSGDLREPDQAYSDGKMLEIENLFGRSDFTKRGRVFVMQGPLRKICARAVKTRMFFLFNDLLLYGHPLTKTRYTNLTLLPLTMLSVVSLPDEEDIVNGFQIFSDQKTFTVQASTAEEKTLWIESITLCVNQLHIPTPTIEWAVPVLSNLRASTTCPLCSVPFTPFLASSRKKTCRRCGAVACASCSENTVILSHLSYKKPQRVCKICYKELAAAGSGLGFKNEEKGETGGTGVGRSGGRWRGERKGKFVPSAQRRYSVDVFSDSSDELLNANSKARARSEKFEKYPRTRRIHGI